MIQLRRQQGFSEEEIAKNVRSDTEQEFYEKLILGKDRSGFGEMNPSVPSGFLNEEEIQLSRNQQNLLATTRYLEGMLGIELKENKKEILSKIMFNSHISKARNGFGGKLAKTDIIRQDQSVYQSREEEESKGFIDKLKGLMSKGGKEGSNLGVGEIGKNLNYGQYGKKKKWR